MDKIPYTLQFCDTAGQASSLFKIIYLSINLIFLSPKPYIAENISVNIK